MADPSRKGIEAFIVTIGDELTKGEIPDTNAAYLAEQLTRLGIPVASILTLPDDHATAVRMIERILRDDGIYLFTGGLGGTRDDITRTVVSKVLGKELRVDPEKTQLLETWYRERNRPFLHADRMQASSPEGGALLDNPVGLAYGFYAKDGDRYIFSLPGVPREMKAMFESGVLPRLEKEGFRAPRCVETLVFAGIPEYVLDREVAAIVSRHGTVRYGTRAGYDVVKVVIESEGNDLEPCLREIEEGLSASFIARGGASLEGVLGGLMIERGLTLSAAESCTAGYLSKVITDVPGSSAYFLGGVVSYSNEAKMHFLGVREETLKTGGAVSEETAEEMARGAMEEFSSDVAVAITGIAGPEGGSKEKPVGTVFICVLGRGRGPVKGNEAVRESDLVRGKDIVIERNAFLGDRESIRQRSVNRALFMLIRFVRRYEKP